MNHQITQIYFSPSGTSEKISNMVCDTINPNDSRKINLLTTKNPENIVFSPDDIVVITLPVFSGRIPSVAKEMLENLTGNGAFGIALVAYGNRDYDDALLELADFMKEKEFNLVGSAAFIARHSIFPQVASNRPDSEDMEIIKAFSSKCKEKIETECLSPFDIKGIFPYKESSSSLPIKPKANSSCNNCGICSKICPANAINANTPRKTNPQKCISCTACIYYCPQQARQFTGFLYSLAGKKFQKDNQQYKKPDLFY